MKTNRIRLGLFISASAALVLSIAVPAQATSTAVPAAKPAVAAVSAPAVSTLSQFASYAAPSYATSTASLAAAAQQAGCVSGTFRAGPGRSRSYGGYTIWGGSYECKLANGTWVGFYCSTPRIPARWPHLRQESTIINTIKNTSADPLDEILALRGASLMPGGANRANVNMQEAMRHVVTYFSGESTLAKGYVSTANATVQGYFNAWVKEGNARAGAREIKVSGPSPAWNVGVTSKLTAKVWFTKPATDVVINNVGISAAVTGSAVKVSASTTTGTTGAVVETKPTKWGSFTTTLTTTTKFPANKVTRWWSYAGYQQYVGLAPHAPITKAVPGTTGPAPAKFVGDCIGCDGYANVVNPEPVCNTTNSAQSFGLNDNSVQRPEVVTLAPGECKAAKSILWKVLHGHSWQVFTWLAANTADKRAVTTKQVVDCPPWPEVEQKFGFNCFDGVFSLSGTAIPDRAGRLIVNGQVTPIVAGGSNSFTTPVDCSKANTFEFSIGSQRTNGTWNDSPKVVLTQAAFALAS